jgi:hypothetical protein
VTLAALVELGARGLPRAARVRRVEEEGGEVKE